MLADVGDASVLTDTVILHCVSISIAYYKVYLYNVCEHCLCKNYIQYIV